MRLPSIMIRPITEGCTTIPDFSFPKLPKSAANANVHKTVLCAHSCLLHVSKIMVFHNIHGWHDIKLDLLTHHHSEFYVQVFCGSRHWECEEGKLEPHIERCPYRWAILRPHKPQIEFDSRPGIHLRSPIRLVCIVFNWNGSIQMGHTQTSQTSNRDSIWGLSIIPRPQIEFYLKSEY